MTIAAPKRFLMPAALAILTAAVGGCTSGNDDGASPSESSVAESVAASDAQQVAPVAAHDLQQGECMTDSGTAAVPDIKVLPCAEPHAFEVFATTELPEGDYPGMGEADALAQEFCRGEFHAFVGVEYDASALDLQYFYPVESAWTEDRGRTVVCLVGNAGGEQSVGTLRGSRR